MGIGQRLAAMFGMTIDPAKRPQTGGLTGAQKVAGSYSLGTSSGYARAPRPGVETYRAMRTCPSVAIARAARFAPVKASTWSVREKRDAPNGAADLIDRYVVQAHADIVRDVLYGVDYGWQPFELVWESVDGALVPKRIKPLEPTMTEIVVNKDTGEYEGLRQKDVTLPPERCWLYTHDQEGDNYHGRSAYENVRENAWWPWMETLKRIGNQSKKVAGATIQITYPPGRGQDEWGSEEDNSVLAQRAAESYKNGGYILVPRVMDSQLGDIGTLIAQGIDPSKLMAWQVDTLAPTSGHTSEMIETLRYYDAAILRGLLVPERAVIEGQYGTKAEAESHAGVMLVMSQEMLSAIVRSTQSNLVDRIIALNYGESAVGSVYIDAAPLIDEEIAMVRDVVKSILTNPNNVDLWQTLTDVTTQIERSGLPVADSVEADQIDGGEVSIIPGVEDGEG